MTFTKQEKKEMVARRIQEIFSPEFLVVLSDVAIENKASGLIHLILMCLSKIIKGTSGSQQFDELLDQLDDMLGKVNSNEKPNYSNTTSLSQTQDPMADFLQFATNTEEKEDIEDDNLEEFDHLDEDQVLKQKPKSNPLDDIRDLLRDFQTDQEDEED